MSFTLGIDAGHGGRDPGVVVDGVREKDVIRALADMLTVAAARFGWAHRQLRYDDATTPIRLRAERANTPPCDAVVSLHTNSAPRPETRGLWILHHETSKRGRLLAACVFASFEAEGWQELLDADADPEVYPDGLASGWSGNRRLGILRLTHAPAILIEVGFLTHRATRELLVIPEVQARIARVIAEGVQNWKEGE